jgi:hypothetical protein
MFGSFLSGLVSGRLSAVLGKLASVPLISGTACAQFSPSREICLVTDSRSTRRDLRAGAQRGSIAASTR